MKNNIKIIFLFALMFFSYSANAIDIEQVIKSSFQPAADKLASMAVMWLSIFVGAQFVLTNIGLLVKGADLETMWAKFLGSLLWVGFCFYLFKNGSGYIDSVGNQFLNLFGVALPNKAAIMAGTLAPGLTLLGASIFVGGIGAVGSVVGGQILMLLAFLIISMGFYFVIKLFMLKLELLIVVVLSPLSFAFLGLNALKDQGIAPLKSLISLIYRITIITLVLSAFSQMSAILLSTMTDGTTKLMSVSNLVDVINPISNAYGPLDLISDISAVLFGYVVLTYLLYKSDSIAASLSGGGTNMGAGDVASAAAAGAALGAAAGSSGNVLNDSMGKVGQSMSDFMKSLGGSGSVSNASASGTGESEPKVVGTAPTPPAKKPEMSLQEMRNHPSAIGNKSKPEPLPLAGAPQSSGASRGNDASVTGVDAGSSSARPLPGQSSRPSGAGETAGIGGAQSTTDQKLDKLMETMGQTNKPSFKDNLANANDHVAKEQATTHVSINTNVE